MASMKRCTPTVRAPGVSVSGRMCSAMVATSSSWSELSARGPHAPVDRPLRVVRGLRHDGLAHPPSMAGGCKTCASVRPEHRLTVRVGIVGGGNISDTHARAAREIPGVELVAFWARDPEKARRLSDRHGGTAFQNLEDMLAHRPLDMVVVGTPSGLHAEHARAAARRGLHVLVEKPLDITTERIDALIDECDRARVKLGVIFQDRAAPHLQWLKHLIAQGGLGKPILVSAHVKWYRPPEYYAGSRWRGTWALDGGGALMNQGIHSVDLLLWLL